MAIESKKTLLVRDFNAEIPAYLDFEAAYLDKRSILEIAEK